MTIKDLPLEDYFTSGHTACPGCGPAILAKVIMKVFGKNTVIYTPANCLLVFGGTYPYLAWKVPYHHVAFENTAVCIAGIRRALKRMGRDDVHVIGIAGDGGTADIGIQALSGAAERNEDVIYIMYDNEAYMNTGIQRSSSTPYGAWTTTTPVGKVRAGKTEFKKDVPRIMIAHNVPYVATACISFPNDLLAKLEKAKRIRGFRYLQILAPCPTGWRFPPEKTIEVGRLAVETGMWTLYEYENGVMRINHKPKMIPVEEYLKLQGRFRHLSEEDVKRIQDYVKRKWESDLALCRAYGGCE
ncbi:MAG: pyruvate synthase subunit beta [Thermoplasmata archaeon]|nr:MAG: pyruvate synthase subunit beta [Thermoplasmata archaeon]